ncbi:MAG: hypothetical protein J7497_17655, partial [Chitinophagaceae bacterium]|nr:hypothetical protein [Chitinophagaceae bacterium]
MKIIPAVIIALLTITFLSCGQNRKPTIVTRESVTPVAATGSATAYSIDTTLSILNWEGYEGLSLGKA